MDTIKKFAPIGAVLLTIFAIVMGFLPGAVAGEAGMKDFSVWEVVFGGQMAYGGQTIDAVGFSFMNLLPFLCVVLAAAIIVFRVMGKIGDIGSIVAAILFLVAGILFFLFISNAQMGDYFSNIRIEYRKDAWEGVIEFYDLGVGAILAAISSFAAAACAAVPVVLEKMGN